MNTPASAGSRVTPERIFHILHAFQQSAALKAGIEVGVFTAIGEGHVTPAALAERCGITERGARILCDSLVLSGLVAKQNGEYSLAPDTAIFLDRRSPAYAGAIANFMVRPQTVALFMDLTETLRSGGANLAEHKAAELEDPQWLDFARSMTPIMTFPANAIADLAGAPKGTRRKVLDIAAGHGIFGITIAQRDANADVYALDSEGVLKIAQENAAAAGVASRYHLLPGSAFELPFGSDYDLVLLTNFLHHFEPGVIEGLLRKVHAALAPRGQAIALEFVPNEDRVSPPGTAFFSLVMLAQTASGDAHTFSEYERMFRSAGFSSCRLQPIPGPESVIIAER